MAGRASMTSMAAAINRNASDRGRVKNTEGSPRESSMPRRDEATSGKSGKRACEPGGGVQEKERVGLVSGEVIEATPRRASRVFGCGQGLHQVIVL